MSTPRALISESATSPGQPGPNAVLDGRVVSCRQLRASASPRSTTDNSLALCVPWAHHLAETARSPVIMRFDKPTARAAGYRLMSPQHRRCKTESFHRRRKDLPRCCVAGRPGTPFEGQFNGL
ncbi:hypothetical protein PCASD_20378 [Puccinia coronata f. sp. avenae]|uniref:Uncharacterized protein n=1 Tax=Puccinia coronata f. sp. avenae TaxID=200324 RepID=A0A2N5TV93_9BASI|nr:hypothetical protein PCASD_20378 [Puccinia coronata f. sp. avenae]